MFETLSFCLHAYSKVGKSTIGGSGPRPLLILDAEGSTKFLPIRKIPWDPHRYLPPVPDGSWDAAIVSIREMADLTKVHDVLQLGQHGFSTVVIDSISEIQRKLKLSLVGLTDEMEWSIWDQLLRQMDFHLRGIRDLQSHPTRPVPVTVFIAETMAHGKTGKLVPNIQGKMGTVLPFLFDLVGYMELAPQMVGGAPVMDPNTGTVTKVRRIHIVQDARWEAGERVQGLLGQFIDVPTIDMATNPQPSTLISDIYFHLFPHMRPTQQGQSA